LVLLVLLTAGLLCGQSVEPTPAPGFDAVAATDAYLARVPPDKKARSDAYFEGGYWLILWDFLYGAAISLLLLSTRLSARMRSNAERATRFQPLRTFAYWAQYLAITSLLGFPLGVYEGFFREHQYGLATQTFGPWLGDQLKTLGLTLVLGGLTVTALFGIAPPAHLAYLGSPRRDRPDRAVQRGLPGIHRAAFQQIHPTDRPRRPRSHTALGPRQRNFGERSL